MSKLRLMTIVGTRPEIIKLSEIIKKSDIHFDHTLVHTGQNYDYTLNEIFFKELGLREPDFYLNVVGSDLGKTLGGIIEKSFHILSEINPDAVLVLGDTNSCLSVLSAKRLKIPIFHMEAGNRCFDENLPEEVNRRIVDHTSDINLCYTEHARRYLNSEGFSKERSFVIGSPMAEILNVNHDKVLASTIVGRLGLENKKYILLSAHREENIDNEENFVSLMTAINEIANFYNIPVVYSAHPRSRKFIKERGFVFHHNVKICEPFGFFDYLGLQQEAFCVVSDSGTLAEESSILKFPSVSIRTSTERPEALDCGNMIIGGISKKSLLQSIDMAVNMRLKNQLGSDVFYYTDMNVSLKVIKIIQSYTNLVNKFVWRKDTGYYYNE